MTTQTKALDSALLAERRQPWSAFGLSVVLQAVAVVGLAWLPALLPERLEPYRPYHVVMLATPTPVVLPPKPEPRARPVETPRPTETARTEAPAIEAPARPRRQVQPVRFSGPTMVARRQTPEVEAPAIQVPVPRTESELLRGSSAVPNLKRPREEVQTGGFGDPHGVPASAARRDRPANINALGQWDLPSGPGFGNGTGGERGERGVVASAGFGRGVAVGAPARGNGGGEVQLGGFGAAETGSAGPRPRREEPREAPLEPVEILAKPRPAYTAEARAKRREGEVVLEVLFTAAGEVRVLRVVRGLGDGLDEAAIAAARQMKFHPARRAGAAVDSVANVIITFQLAD